MAKQVTDEMRQLLEKNRSLCAEVEAKPGNRAWIVVHPILRGDAIDTFVFRRFEMPKEWIEREYHACDDELTDLLHKEVYTETELNDLLHRWLPDNVDLIPVADDPDFPM